MIILTFHNGLWIFIYIPVVYQDFDAFVGAIFDTLSLKILWHELLDATIINTLGSFTFESETLVIHMLFNAQIIAFRIFLLINLPIFSTGL